jgi:hypothetical protein
MPAFDAEDTLVSAVERFASTLVRQLRSPDVLDG